MDDCDKKPPTKATAGNTTGNDCFVTRSGIKTNVESIFQIRFGLDYSEIIFTN